MIEEEEAALLSQTFGRRLASPRADLITAGNPVTATGSGPLPPPTLAPESLTCNRNPRVTARKEAFIMVRVGVTR